MNLNLFDNNMNGMVMRERENAYDTTRSNNSGASISRFPASTPLAMAYVPFQQWGEVYNEDDAFDSGTLFPQLDFPFERGGSTR